MNAMGFNMGLLASVKDPPEGGPESEQVHGGGERQDAARGNGEKSFEPVHIGAQPTGLLLNGP